MGKIEILGSGALVWMFAWIFIVAFALPAGFLHAITDAQMVGLLFVPILVPMRVQ